MSDTPEQEPVADDISADLAQAFNETPADDDPVVTPDTKDEGDDTKPPEKPAEKPDDEDDDDPDDDDPDDADDDDDDDLEPPVHWSTKDKAIFAKQGKEAKHFLLERHKSMEADYTRKSQEIAVFRRQKEDIDQLLAPYREQFQRSGMDDVGAIRSLVSAHAFLERDPVNAVQHLVESYRIDPNQLIAALATVNRVDLNQLSQAPQPDPNVIQLQRELKELKDSRIHEQSTQQQQVFQSHLQQVEAFATETDAQGNPKHPYFDEVATEIKAFIATGLSLPEAYERAIYANPTVRQQIAASERKAQRKREREEAAKKAAQAKQTGFDVSGEGAAATGGQQFDNIEDELRANLAAAGRV